MLEAGYPLAPDRDNVGVSLFEIVWRDQDPDPLQLTEL